MPVLDPFRRTYMSLTDEERKKLDDLKAAAEVYYRELEKHGDSRELALARTHLEESVMWATKHVTR